MARPNGKVRIAREQFLFFKINIQGLCSACWRIYQQEQKRAKDYAKNRLLLGQEAAERRNDHKAAAAIKSLLPKSTSLSLFTPNSGARIIYFFKGIFSSRIFIDLFQCFSVSLSAWFKVGNLVVKAYVKVRIWL